MSNEPGLVPELTVTDYEASRRFWCDLVGFSLRYERPEEGFGYLVLGNAHLMLDQIDQGRTWATGPLEFPLGRGINFEVPVDNLDGTFDFAADKPVSFEQMITILARITATPDEVAASRGDLSAFVDGDMASSWSRAPSRMGT